MQAKNAQFRRTEKGGKGMALKIRARAESMPDGTDNLEIRAHTKWKRLNFSNGFC
jgi:hypothetical protein